MNRLRRLSPPDRVRSRVSQSRLLLAFVLLFATCPPAIAQRSTASPTAKTKTELEDPLDRFNDSVEALVKKIWPSVVQILVTSYGSTGKR